MLRAKVLKRDKLTRCPEYGDYCIKYKQRPGWYTNDAMLLQRPGVGFRRVAKVSLLEPAAVINLKEHQDRLMLDAAAYRY